MIERGMVREKYRERYQEREKGIWTTTTRDILLIENTTRIHIMDRGSVYQYIYSSMCIVFVIDIQTYVVLEDLRYERGKERE